MWRIARLLKLDWWLGGIALLVVTSLALARCGGTGSDLVGFPEGDTFVNEGCNSDSACIRFSISPSRIPADGASQATFIATLLNTDGSPAAGEQVCFFVEDTAAATIVEPVGDNCQITNADGRVSGRVQAGTIPASVKIVARSFARSLETEVTLLLGESSSLPEPVPAGLSIATNPGSLEGGEAAIVTARLRDSNNQPIPGATIVFSRFPAVGLALGELGNHRRGWPSKRDLHGAGHCGRRFGHDYGSKRNAFCERGHRALGATANPGSDGDPVCGAIGSLCAVGTDCCSLNCDPVTTSCVP